VQSAERDQFWNTAAHQTVRGHNLGNSEAPAAQANYNKQPNMPNLVWPGYLTQDQERVTARFRNAFKAPLDETEYLDQTVTAQQRGLVRMA